MENAEIFAKLLLGTHGFDFSGEVIEFLLQFVALIKEFKFDRILLLNNGVIFDFKMLIIHKSLFAHLLF